MFLNEHCRGGTNLAERFAPMVCMGGVMHYERILKKDYG
jgi:hypothetical protein